MIQSFRRVHDINALTADDWNRMADEVERLSRLDLVGGTGNGIFDGAGGYFIDVSGGADVLADASTAGDVSLANQSMGQGQKYFANAVGIGTTGILSGVGLEIIGFTYFYHSGSAICWGGGNFPAAPTDGATLNWDAAHTVSITTPTGTGAGKFNFASPSNGAYGINGTYGITGTINPITSLTVLGGIVTGAS